LLSACHGPKSVSSYAAAPKKRATPSAELDRLMRLDQSGFRALHGATRKLLILSRMRGRCPAAEIGSGKRVKIYGFIDKNYEKMVAQAAILLDMAHSQCRN